MGKTLCQIFQFAIVGKSQIASHVRSSKVSSSRRHIPRPGRRVGLGRGRFCRGGGTWGAQRGYTLPRNFLVCPINWGTQLTMEIMNDRHPWQFKISKFLWLFWSYQLNSTANSAYSLHRPNGLKWGRTFSPRYGSSFWFDPLLTRIHLIVLSLNFLTLFSTIYSSFRKIHMLIKNTIMAWKGLQC